MNRMQCLKSIKVRRSPWILTRFKSTDASASEVEHFRNLAPTWWDTHGNQRILHLMNLARLDFIQRNIRNTIKIENSDIYVPGFNYKKFLPKDISTAVQEEFDNEIEKILISRKLKVLDVGCGGGILAESMGRLPYVQHVTGVDLTKDCIEVAKLHAKKDPALKGKLTYELKAVEDVEPNEGYDIVTCFEMLEHVDSPSSILSHSWRKLKPNGILFISTINKDLISWFTTIFMGEYVLKIVPVGTHHLNKYVNSKDIIKWFQSTVPNKYQVMDVKGTMYLPFKAWVEHNCSDVGNYFLAIKKLPK
ncbi:hypothetical protein TBLA_0B02330 [Henningerozyma blattae CBS 6284]|uniref:Ubiquinone biosynthesis O-methyltransferase, mitochondrial n=1 Tax=Henningerozyma blattae (strain ATCC 34711 / CBS 6284 / DSM 70876 / NBRC 10599 / NRRL Y-10934 / UCD 77-7) TaxID=1071380 RepID=I2GY73_HENB6|nr:hypothetical protein TBLA_0B02330 [Tetrapisispora blattae CBS 6284]CCH59075.1 hypothetical protein TBLA_0B02330 [Tetrapisispora blattae CBS 6284]